MARLTLGWIPGGDAGAFATLAQMRQLVRKAQLDPLTREVATSIIRYESPRDGGGQARALREWLATHLQFTKDPRGLELLQEPRAMLQVIVERYAVQGDCDDAAILGAALATAVGLPARFRVMAFGAPDAPYQHVVTDVLTPQGWLDFDITRSSRSSPPHPTRVHIEKAN